MAKIQNVRGVRLLHLLKRKIAGADSKRAPSSPPGPLPVPVPASAARTDAADPLGSCRYADGLGQMQCESPVTKSYCDSRTGFFTPGGRC